MRPFSMGGASALSLCLLLSCGGSGDSPSPSIVVTGGAGAGGASLSGMGAAGAPGAGAGATGGAQVATAGAGGAAGQGGGGSASAAGGDAGMGVGQAGAGQAGAGQAGAGQAAGGQAAGGQGGEAGGGVGGQGGEGGQGVGGAGGQAGAAGGVSMPGACKNDGALSCGGPIGGDADKLYACSGGAWVVDHACNEPCEALPPGIPDRCPSDVVVPKALVKVLSVTPYVEGDCIDTTWDGWPYQAKECTYSAGGLTATVTVATPSPERVALWITDASVFVPALWRARLVDPDAYEQGLIEFANHTLGQSSRIFPLEGGILENMGSGWVNYPFLKGVTDGCSSGCYCRINSLHRTEWCTYQAFLGPESYEDCIAKVGDSGLTKGWGNLCLGNHIDAWKSAKNEHFRAKAHQVNLQVASACPKSSCAPGEVVAAVHAALFE